MLNEIDLSRADLNLLTLFEVVLRERHVGRAAARLNLSPSAVSHGLKRLRLLLNDPLFLRTPKGVVPTARAAQLAEPIAEVLARVRNVISEFRRLRSGDIVAPLHHRRTRRHLVGDPASAAGDPESPRARHRHRLAPAAADAGGPFDGAGVGVGAGRISNPAPWTSRSLRSTACRRASSRERCLKKTSSSSRPRAIRLRRSRRWISSAGCGIWWCR